MKSAFTGIIVCLLAVGCTTHEENYSIAYHPDQPFTHATASTNGQTNSTNSSGHLYTEAPRSSLAPVSSNSASRIYSEPPSQPQAGTDGTLNGSLLNADNPRNTQDRASTDADREIIRRIRQSVRADYALSIIAPDLKISAKNGQVALAGAVKNPVEKRRLEALAEKTEGVVGVQDQLSEKPD